MTNYELGLLNLRNDLIKMGLSNINADVICESLNKQNRWTPFDLTRWGLSSYDFVNIALCWSTSIEGSDYWLDLHRELIDYLDSTDCVYLLGEKTHSFYNRDPLFIMKPVQNFNILD